LSWQLSFEPLEDESDAGELAMLTAFRQELAEAGHDSIAELTRFHLHLDEDALGAFTGRFLELIEEYRVGDDARRDGGAPGYGGMIAVHRLADPT
jgi:hypothetical protein